MVGHLARIDEDEIFIERTENLLLLGCCQFLCEGECLLLHGVGQVLRIGTWVGEQFLFVQVLRAIQNLLGAVFKTLVALFLEFGQVKRLLRKLLLLLVIDFCYSRFGRRDASRYNRIRFCFFFKNRDFKICFAFGVFFAFDILCLEPFPCAHDAVVEQFLELFYDGVAFYNQV